MDTLEADTFVKVTVVSDLAVVMAAVINELSALIFFFFKAFVASFPCVKA